MLIYSGVGLGTMLMPPAAGYLFKRVDPMAVWYLNLACVACQIVATVALNCIFRHRSKDMQYEKVAQDDN